MKFITVGDIRTSSAEIWKQLPAEQEMVVTNNGKPIALLTPLSAVRRARAANAVHQLRKIARENELDRMSEAEIQAEIDAARTAQFSTPF